MVSREREKKDWRGIVMDDTTPCIVSYLGGLNALGSWPRSVRVHIIKPHKGRRGARWSCCPDRPRLTAGLARLQRQPLLRGFGFYNLRIFHKVFQMINISSGQRQKNQSSPAGPSGCRCVCASEWTV